MLGLSVLPATLQFVGFLFLPESPRWLIQHGMTQKARRVLSQIRGNQNIDEEYDSIKNSIEEEEKDSGGEGRAGDGSVRLGERAGGKSVPIIYINALSSCRPLSSVLICRFSIQGSHTCLTKAC